ncbi:MAG: lipopolysaccharide/colanic/teichoic acid biosynthesis glycosyltransferase [Planctomycetota bacterium]|jgi:lipopolysaccharide/colanic/teichoic acid biosynthesis glycosyltransferase
MLPQFLRSKRGFLSRLSTARALDGAIPVSELELQFQKERARADRSGNVFSMVVFRVKRGDLNLLAPMVQYARERMRIYDTVGVLDSGRIAFLLPQTPPKGAWVFADDCLDHLRKLYEVAKDSDLAVRCEVFGYPLDWQNKNTENTDQEDQPPLGTGTDGGAFLHAMHSDAKASRALSGPQAKPVGDLSGAFLETLPWTKRIVDLVATSIFLVACAPLMLLTAALVKLTSPGPVIFKQQRAGRGGVPFTFYKFRSMYVDAEERRQALQKENDHKQGPIFKMRNDPRITPVGRILRRLSIDELPQLLNLLRGDMTLIGPRPPTLDEAEAYEPWQRKRLDITGGLTCIWQVSGRSEVGFEEWVRMDLEYQRKRSLLFDAGLLFRTVGAVVSGRGAY